MAALVDQDASTAETEGTHESFYNKTTEEAANKIILEYQHDLRPQISSHFPSRIIEKSVGEDFILGRGKGSDVLLNDERMSRTYAAITTKPGGDEGVRFFLRNCTKNKSVILELYQKKPMTLKPGMEAELRDRSRIKLMDVEFRVSINYGSTDSTELELEVRCGDGLGNRGCEEMASVQPRPMAWPCEHCPQNVCQRGVDCSDDRRPQLYTNPTTTVRLDAPTAPVTTDDELGGPHARHSHGTSNGPLLNPLHWDQFPRGPALGSLNGCQSLYNSGFPAMRLQNPGTGDPAVSKPTDRTPTEHEEGDN